ncbi:hypothetical protein [Enterobacter quasiroggenkampii]|uniref:hypothetical protein n=2 Tax=Enterobacter TaxID=547 RepID=UPI0021D1F7E8|nr:hypothetical protein [Enterobacter quasiroggenkampii]MCU6307032.1 hypothetical protein [Enterobacter quasiroggenkampii]MCU6386384.1 hypothetical protein [Enterobacter quasiroggenkampii]MCU6396404.1 hypothetical protein [Enterobacter quasiroggenkampii]MCU6404816.1 hypothetical protein [Enterobacter quasiroggenkampii]MCU6418906.1 hypothetical protein [Enterobacter quasiroggenkampii]
MGLLLGLVIFTGAVVCSFSIAVSERVVVENNTLGIAPPVPVPVPGVPVNPGDQVTKNANDKITLAVDDLFDAVDKATQCSFGRACSSDDSDQGLKPNVAGNMTDDEKAEYGGAGSGTPGGWGPEDEEKARAQQAQIEAKKQVESLGYDSNKVSHIFADKHQMDKLVSEFGSPEAALERMHEAVQPLAKNPGSYQTGSCWVTVRVGGNDVAVKGIVINGEFRISTARMRPF